MKHRHLLILGALLLAGCANPPASSEALIEVVQAEPLVAASVGADSVTIRVISTGCTTKESFMLLWDPDGDRSAITFARRKLDLCKAAPTAVDLSWTFEEMEMPKGARVTVLNPLRAN